MYRSILFIILLLISMNIYPSYPVRFCCKENGLMIFEIQIFDMEYNLAFLNQKNQEQIVLSFKDNAHYFESKNGDYIISFSDFSQVDENGDGVVTGNYKFPGSEKVVPVTCDTFTY